MKNIILISLSFVFFLSCNNTKSNSVEKLNHTLEGCTFYVLEERVNFYNYYAYVKEIKLDFISSNRVEARMTFYADVNGYKIIKDTTNESVIFEYKYEKGFLELPKLNLITRVNVLSNGVLRMNTGDFFYPTSIVKFLDTDSAFNRVNQTTKDNMGSIYKNFFKKTMQGINNSEIY